MKGYKIVYKDNKGIVDATFFGEPISNIDVDKESVKNIIVETFKNAYPKRRIISVTPSDSVSWKYSD